MEQIAEKIFLHREILENIDEQIKKAGNDSKEIKLILAQITADYRKLLWPEKAIETAENYYQKYCNDILSGQVFTSLGAAYIDLVNKESAFKCLKFAETFEDIDPNYLEKTWGRYYRIFESGA